MELKVSIQSTEDKKWQGYKFEDYVKFSKNNINLLKRQ